MKEYRTVEFEASDEFIEKKSRFIGYACPVKTQQQANEFIAKIKSKHWDATHNVHAFVLRQNNIQRSCDDGEPSKTAGVPVLDVILKEKLCDVCVVVTRYFGGTLLGAGGLVRAYSHASKIALAAANIITMTPCTQAVLKVDYSFYDRTVILLNEFSAVCTDTIFEENVKISFNIKSTDFDLLQNKLIQLSNGKYSAVSLGEIFGKM